MNKCDSCGQIIYKQERIIDPQEVEPKESEHVSNEDIVTEFLEAVQQMNARVETLRIMFNIQRREQESLCNSLIGLLMSQNRAERKDGGVSTTRHKRDIPIPSTQATGDLKDF
jgi:Lon protease-like protein